MLHATSLRYSDAQRHGQKGVMCARSLLQSSQQSSPLVGELRSPATNEACLDACAANSPLPLRAFYFWGDGRISIQGWFTGPCHLNGHAEKGSEANLSFRTDLKFMKVIPIKYLSKPIKLAKQQAYMCTQAYPCK